MKKVLIALAAILIIPYLISAVITKEEVRKIENGASDPNSTSSVSKESAKTAFMSGCDDGSFTNGINQTSYCSCMFDTMEAEKGVNWIADLGINKTETEAIEAMTPYASRCVARQQAIET